MSDIARLPSEDDPDALERTLAQAMRAVIRQEVERVTAPKKYLGIAEVAEQLSVSESGVRKWVREGKLQARHAQGRKVIAAEEVERFLRERESEE